MNELVALYAVFFLIVIIAVILLITGKKDKWVSTEDFEDAKSKLRPFCSDAEFAEFRDFLRSYKGGYVKRSSGKIIYQDYLGREKGDLKGIFFNVVVPNPNLQVSDKEEFRRFIMSLGVNGVDKRPSYETRDSKLKNKEKDEDDHIRKEVGNKGEKIVRDILDALDDSSYAVINGPALKFGDTVKEFDHIIVGRNGIFIIETKAFGMSDGNPSRASLFIDAGDKWIIRKNEKNRDLISPTEQVMEEKKLLDEIISCPIDIRPILALSNTELFIKNNIELPYEVIRADKLRKHIENNGDIISDNDRFMILENIDKSRIN